MTQQQIREDYYKYLNDLISQDGYSSQAASHQKVLRLLHSTNFVYIHPMDENRASDGLDLRDSFASDEGIGSADVDLALNYKPCSMLEMIAALALRCEGHITEDSHFGNRTGEWFFTMLDSLGLGDMDDNHFDGLAAADILTRFSNRDYQPDGSGGLFTVPDCDVDMTKIDIWYQMMRYLNAVVYAHSSEEGREP